MAQPNRQLNVFFTVISVQLSRTSQVILNQYLDYQQLVLGQHLLFSVPLIISVCQKKPGRKICEVFSSSSLVFICLFLFLALCCQGISSSLGKWRFKPENKSQQVGLGSTVISELICILLNTLDRFAVLLELLFTSWLHSFI